MNLKIEYRWSSSPIYLSQLTKIWLWIEAFVLKVAQLPLFENWPWINLELATQLNFEAYGRLPVGCLATRRTLKKVLANRALVVLRLVFDKRERKRWKIPRRQLTELYCAYEEVSPSIFVDFALGVFCESINWAFSRNSIRKKFCYETSEKRCSRGSKSRLDWLGRGILQFYSRICKYVLL